jgi:hypothetical protein
MALRPPKPKSLCSAQRSRAAQPRKEGGLYRTQIVPGAKTLTSGRRYIPAPCSRRQSALKRGENSIRESPIPKTHTHGTRHPIRTLPVFPLVWRECGLFGYRRSNGSRTPRRPKYRRHHFVHQCLGRHPHPAADGAERGRECLAGHLHLCHLPPAATIPASARTHLLGFRMPARGNLSGRTEDCRPKPLHQPGGLL